MARPSRIEAARGRTSLLKRALAATAALAFVAATGLARATHPGTTGRTRTDNTGASTQSQSSVPSTSSSQSEDSQSGDGSFSIAPSTSQPQVQTGVS